MIRIKTTLTASASYKRTLSDTRSDYKHRAVDITPMFLKGGGSLNVICLTVDMYVPARHLL